MPELAAQCSAAGLFEIERDAFADDAWSEDALRGLVADDGVLVLTEPGLPCLAYAAFRTVLDEAELLRVAVRREAWRRGLARRVLQRGLENLAERGVVICHLEVRDDNTPALRLYEALGFERVGGRPSYYADGCDAALLSKPLSKNLPGH